MQTSLCTGRAAGLVTVIQTEGVGEGVLAGGWDWEGQAHLKTRRRKEIWESLEKRFEKRFNKGQKRRRRRRRRRRRMRRRRGREEGGGGGGERKSGSTLGKLGSQHQRNWVCFTFSFFFFFKHLYWSIIALQWCVSFCFITKWISYTYTICSHFSSLLHLCPSHPPYPTPLGGHRAPSWSPCAMRLLPTS